MTFGQCISHSSPNYRQIGQYRIALQYNMIANAFTGNSANSILPYCGRRAAGAAVLRRGQRAPGSAGKPSSGALRRSSMINAHRLVYSLAMSEARRILSAMNASAPLANLITLGARDIPTLRDFYRSLGWPQILDDGEFAAFELRGIVLALSPSRSSPVTGTPNLSRAPVASGSPSA